MMASMDTKPLGIRLYRAVHDALCESALAMSGCPEMSPVELEGLAAAATNAVLHVITDSPDVHI